MRIKMKKLMFFLLMFSTLQSCNNHKSLQPSFAVLDGKDTGINFRNDLESFGDFNMFKYMYFFNGAGVGCGDFNNDGWIDLIFASNQGSNKLYLNQGGLKFVDKTLDANIQFDKAWNTGVSVIDINGDGLLDIYVCRVGNYDKLKSRNQLLVCKKIKDGVPYYEDMAHEYGIDFSCFSTNAAFFDYDLDGDLDMYLMNHSLRFNGTFYPKDHYANSFDSLAGDRLLMMDNDTFIDVTKKAGISGNIISYGLGLCISDINLDGYPDIYIGNDFHEDDYYYINNKNGTFTDISKESFQCTSQFSMGIDICDLNNDGWPEIMTADMLPSDPYLLRRSLGEDSYDLFHMKLKYGYNHQYARNTLQYNLNGRQFVELGRFSNMFATDWSWSILMPDLNNDGLKDVFISNGIPKRMNDIDYIKFIGNESVQQQIKDNNISEKNLTLINKFPEIKIENKIYFNDGDFAFRDMYLEIQKDKKTFSNGSAYADFDNDGDLDLVVNNINDGALIYQNLLERKSKNSSYRVVATEDTKNKYAIGSKILVFKNKEIQLYENYPTRGFMSSMHHPFLIAKGISKPDSVLYIWPDHKYEKLKLNDIKNGIINVVKKDDLKYFDYQQFREKKLESFNFKSIQSMAGFNHVENNFIEFDREPLIPHMTSRCGPAICVGDFNNDQLDDIYLGSSKDNLSKILLQNINGKFDEKKNKSLDDAIQNEETDATLMDVNNDHNLDLIVVCGGSEFSLNSINMLAKCYINDGKGNLIYDPNIIDSECKINASCIKTIDFNRDGRLDLFIGARSVPYFYGQPPRSFVLINMAGKFKIDQEASNIVSKAGMVTNADVSKNILYIGTEWSGIYSFDYSNDFKLDRLTDKSIWCNGLKVTDYDSDGDDDILVGNMGENMKLKLNSQNPLTMYYGDFDQNGIKEQLLSYNYNGKVISLNNYEEILKQMPRFKKDMLKAEDFATAEFDYFFKFVKPNDVLKYEINFTSSFLLVKDNSTYSVKALPWKAQLTNINQFFEINYNNDTIKDYLCGGNFFHHNIQLGNSDGSPLFVLVGRKDKSFDVVLLNELLQGEVRKITDIKIQNKKNIILGRNNEDLQFLTQSE